MSGFSGFGRRSILKGMLGGGVVSVGLPLLDMFLNSNGTALAAGAPIPVRFGTWFWGCGVNPGRCIPTATGANYQLPPDLEPLQAFKKDFTYLTGFNASFDGRPNLAHFSAHAVMLSGVAPIKAGANFDGEMEAPTVDVLISDVIGKGSRFRSIEVASTGDPRHSYSRRGSAAINPSETSPAALYQRVYGPEFKDPNSGEFVPDPQFLARQSALTVVTDQRKTLMKQVGAADRARLDEYFTSLRQLEQQIAVQLEKPAPAKACAPPAKTDELPKGTEVGQVRANHKMFAQLVAMALACNQTKVFNIVYSDAPSSLRRPGSTATHHQITHEEPVNAEVGYQPEHKFFVQNSMEAAADFLAAMAAIPEGDGTLLDNSLVFMHSDTQFAKVHSVDSIPVMICGKAGGKVKTGLHLAGNGDPITRIGLTLQQVMGLSPDSWGTKGMETRKPIAELLTA